MIDKLFKALIALHLCLVVGLLLFWVTPEEVSLALASEMGLPVSVNDVSKQVSSEEVMVCKVVSIHVEMINDQAVADVLLEDNSGWLFVARIHMAQARLERVTKLHTVSFISNSNGVATRIIGYDRLGKQIFTVEIPQSSPINQPKHPDFQSAVFCFTAYYMVYSYYEISTNTR